jgi:prevent-host-death family protein
MNDVPLTDAKAHMSDLIEQATQGTVVRITRRRKPVAQTTSVNREPKPIDQEKLRALTNAMPFQDKPTRDWIATIRDGARY